MEFIIKRTKKPKLSSPVVIEGLPGIGNVARITTDFLIDKLKAKKLLTINSPSFPNSVLMNDDSTIELPKIDMFYTQNPDLIIIVGDAQPTEEKDSYALANKILDIVSDYKPKRIITIGGIGLISEPHSPKVYGAVTDKKLKTELKEAGVILDGAKTVGIIIGATGMLLGISKLRGIPAVSLLAQTFGDPTYFGFRASKKVLETLRKYLKLKFSLQDIDKEIKSIEDKKKKRIESMRAVEQHDSIGTRYIG